MLQRISNQEQGSSSSAAGSDAARRGDQRRGNELETRERGARFRAALGKHESAAVEGRAELQANRAEEGSQNRVEERGRDRAAAAQLLGRLNLEQGQLEGARQGRQEASGPTDGKGAQGAQGGSDGQSTTAAGADASKLQGRRPDEALGPSASQAELAPELEAIEDAIHKVMETDKADAGSDAATTPPADFAIPGATPWARPEGPARPEAPRQLPSPPPGTETYHRLLMGQGPAGAEARLNITQGPLAGLQIHLTNGPGGVQAAVLTQGASSRQTLVSAMDQVAQRLRQKGHTLDIRFGSPSGTQQGGQTSRRG